MSVQPATRPIFIVDDDPDAVPLLRRQVEKANSSYSVRSFCDGAEVRDFLLRTYGPDGAGCPPCLMFVDLKMPKFNGFEVLAWLRAHSGFSPITVVVVSSSNLPEDMERARNLGAREYLLKYPQAQTIRLLAETAVVLPSRQSIVGSG